MSDLLLREHIAAKLARAVLAGFESMFAEFLNITLAAQGRFERAAWGEVQQAMRQRLTVYEGKIAIVAETAKQIAYEELDDAQIWYQAKGIYARLVAGHDNALIAQTFFNSVFGAIRGHKKIRDVQVFILDPQYRPLQGESRAILQTLDSENGIGEAFAQLLQTFPFRLPFENQARDLAAIGHTLEKLEPHMAQAKQVSLEFGRSLFFRNKAAYIIGRLIDHEHECAKPFAIALLNDEQGGLYVDTLLLGEGQLSMLFGYARAYFMVDSDQPVRYVEYLATLMPHKQRFELFNAIGFIKHAKTEFYRYKVDHTRQLPAAEKYQLAPGVPGMVMLVFTTEHSDYVYKVIKDRFTPPKNISRAQVMEKYRFVKNADRIGRLVDTHEFRFLAFDLSRFSAELLDIMRREIGDSLEISGNALVLKHVYVERRMQPLNLFVKTADDATLDTVMQDYGKAIKQLAAANVFPGDMLMKNFGVTRWNKVVFYDYDEICPLSDCHFRALPAPQTPQQEMAAGPWFDVQEGDVFPEQFPVFFAGHEQARQAFNRYHQDLYTPHRWQQIQADVAAGKIADVFPYKDEWRFPRG